MTQVSVLRLHLLRAGYALLIVGLGIAILCCPRPSGPSTMLVWITKGTTNAEQEAQAGGDHRQAA